MVDSVFAQLCALRDYCDRIPGHRKGSRTHISTLIRWATKGVMTPAGERVRLRAVRAGSKWLCCDEWFEEFLSTLTAANQPGGGSENAPLRSPAVRNRAAAEAVRKLDEHGVR